MANTNVRNSIRSLTDPYTALTTRFAIPDCMIQLGLAALRLIPSFGLVTISEEARKAKQEAYAEVAAIFKKIYDFFGIYSVAGPDGLFQIKSDILDGLPLSITKALAVIEQGANLFDQVSDIVESVQNCLAEFEASRNAGSGGGSTDSSYLGIETDEDLAGAVDAFVGQAMESASGVQDFIDDIDGLLSRINKVLIERALDPTLEPSIADEEVKEEIFRLVFGPPKAKKGQFLFSQDGLYYDSQTRTYEDGEEVPTQLDIGFIPDQSKWRMDHAPSLGGRGTQVSIRELDQYFNTILDKNIIDTSQYLLEHYEKDHALRVLEGQKLKVIGSLEASKKSLIVEGHSEDSAIVQNYQQQIFSEVNHFENKIKKRKKQIELAVKAPDLFNSSSFFLPGEVPINDFSYLKDFDIAVDVKKQKELVLDHGEVSGVILPLQPIFVKSADTNKSTILDGLTLQSLGTGDIPIVPLPDSEVKPVIRLTDAVVTDGLIAIYNFFDSELQDPDSNIYQVISCNNSAEQNAQLVGTDPSKVFDKGLGIPKLRGIVERQDNLEVCSLGSYLRLPESTKMQNLMYNKVGCSFDTWVHIPNFGTSSLSQEAGLGAASLSANDGSWSDYNYYKLLFANENVGGVYEDNPLNMLNNFDTDTVRGVIMGFTRDPQWTQPGTIANRGKDIDIAINHPSIPNAEATTASSVFLIAPVQSVSAYGTYDVDFIREGECFDSDNGYLGFTVNTSSQTQSGYSLNDCSSSFVHLSISFDVLNDSIKVFLNGELLKEGSMSTTFGIKPKQPPRLPTFVKGGSHQYSNVEYPYLTDFDNGPNTGTFFTPWIVGGGWTDGLKVNVGDTEFGTFQYYGGFMNISHGFQSGLTGYIGSLKIYEKPLSISEALINYKANREFFDNIDL